MIRARAFFLAGFADCCNLSGSVWRDLTLITTFLLQPTITHTELLHTGIIQCSSEVSEEEVKYKTSGRAVVVSQLVSCSRSLPTEVCQSVIEAQSPESPRISR